jgi:hypothetical protein
VCDVCITTEHRRAPFPKQVKYRADKPLELVHGDLCGPVTTATPRGRRYILLLVDDATSGLLSSQRRAARWNEDARSCGEQVRPIWYTARLINGPLRLGCSC